MLSPCGWLRQARAAAARAPLRRPSSRAGAQQHAAPAPTEYNSSHPCCEQQPVRQCSLHSVFGGLCKQRSTVFEPRARPPNTLPARRMRAGSF